MRKFAEEYEKARNGDVNESLEIPPNEGDEVEMDLRRLMYGKEPEGSVPEKPAGMSDEKWAEIQAKSGGKNREKASAKAREKSAKDPIFQRYGDAIVRWYRNDLGNGVPEADLRRFYVTGLDNLRDEFKTYEEYLDLVRKNGLTKEMVVVDLGNGKTEKVDPFGAFKTKALSTRDAAKSFMSRLGDLVGSASGERGIESSSKTYAIRPEDRENVGLLASTEHVMCWFTRTYESTNKFVYQLWQNSETLGRGDVYGDPTEQTPYCTHSRQHWNDYSEGDEYYTQYWFLKKPEGEFDWTDGDLRRENVVRIFNAMKGMGP